MSFLWQLGHLKVSLFIVRSFLVLLKFEELSMEVVYGLMYEHQISESENVYNVNQSLKLCRPIAWVELCEMASRRSQQTCLCSMSASHICGVYRKVCMYVYYYYYYLWGGTESLGICSSP
jgi:hypothetical protein